MASPARRGSGKGLSRSKNSAFSSPHGDFKEPFIDTVINDDSGEGDKTGNLMESESGRSHSLWRLQGVSLTGSAVEYGWAAGESVIIPHLLAKPLSLSPSTASLIFLVNPLFGICLQPLLGRASDRCRTSCCGRRKIFIFFLGLIATVCLLVLVFYDKWLLSRQHQIVLCFVAFGIMDLCHDLLLVPGRSLLLDMALSHTSESTSEETINFIESRADNLYNLYTLIGRFLALCVGSFPLVFWGYSHFQVFLGTSATFLTLSCGTALFVGKDKSFEGDAEEANGEYAPIKNVQEKSSTVLETGTLNHPRDPGHGGMDTEDEDTEDEGGEDKRRRKRHRLLALALLLMAQFTGWTLVCLAVFWWTTWIGINTVFGTSGFRVSMVTAAVQTLSGMVFVPFYQATIRMCSGTKRMYFLSELSISITLILYYYSGPNNPYALLSLMVLSGPSYSIHSTAIYALVRGVVGHKRVGWATGIVNNTLPAAQIFVSIFSGFVVTDCGNDTPQCLPIGGVYFWCGAVGCIVNLSIILYDLVFSIIPSPKVSSSAEEEEE